MINCPKCNKELENGTQFCDSCGTQIFETIFCPNCGKQTSTEFAFCQGCGASITESPTEKSVNTVEISETKKKPPKKAFIFGGIGIAIVAVIILVISLFSGGKSGNNFALYLKDNEIFLSDLKKGSEAWQLTSPFIDAKSDSIPSLGGHPNFSEMLGLYTYVSEDGKYIFFIDKISEDDKEIKLYYRETDNPKVEAIKIDSGIKSYTVNDASTLVTYLKEEGGLYQYKIGKDSKDKIASEVKDFEVSDDGKKIVYINFEDSIYLKYVDKDKEKIAKGVSSLEYLSKDFTTVYYIKDGSLYKQVEGEDKVKISSDVYEVIKIYDSGEVYYLKSDSEKLSLMNYVTDDMKDSDATLTEPEYPYHPSYLGYDTAEEYEAAQAEYDAAFEAYHNAYDAYSAKLNRDYLRESLEKETLEQSSYTLFFFNGTEETIITDAFVSDGYYDYGSGYTVADDVAVISYEAYKQSNLEKVKLSEINSVYDVKEMVKASMFSSSERYIAVKNTATIVEQEKDATNFIISADGAVVYYIDDIPDENNYGKLYRISIKNGVVGKAEVYDSDVYTDDISFVDGSKIKYFKNYKRNFNDYKDNKGELYIDKVKIDYDVYANSINYYSDLDKVFYFTDRYDENDNGTLDENNNGTLKVYENGESVKIADDVHDYSVMADGRVLYLNDYSLNYYKGELHEWHNGKTKKIDDDVVYIIHIYDGKYRRLIIYDASYSL